MMQTTKKLPVKLTLEETKLRAEALGKALAEHSELETAKKASADHFKGKLEAVDIEIADLGRILRTGEEDRPVPVTEKKDFRRGTVEIVRLDTYEVVESRPMTVEERQSSLFHEEAPGGEKPAEEKPGDEPPAPEAPKKRGRKKKPADADTASP